MTNQLVVKSKYTHAYLYLNIVINDVNPLIVYLYFHCNIHIKFNWLNQFYLRQI